MDVPTELQAVKLIEARLAELLGLEPTGVVRPPRGGGYVPDALIELGGFTFVVEWKGLAAVPRIAEAARLVRTFASKLGKRAVPLVAAPFMGPTARVRCEEALVGWLDLSGNANIVAPGLRLRIEGQPNRFLGPGRPASAFAPKSARIARWLLMHPTRRFTQRELAKATGMDEGFTSRIVSKLEADGLVGRDDAGRIGAQDPSLLLDAWAESYRFSKHRIVYGHMAERTSEAHLRGLARALAEQRQQYAATGLGAAWLLDGFAGFRLVTIYVAAPPEPPLLERLGFREGELGANTWLVLPNDEGVFQGAREVQTIQCVHPVQAYLDLLGHPERAKEAAEQLRRHMLTWINHG